MDEMYQQKYTPKSKSKTNPRKFSEKIALLKQKEAEINNSFNVVMKDVKIPNENNSTGTYGSSLCGAVEAVNLSEGSSPFYHSKAAAAGAASSSTSYVNVSPTDTNSTAAAYSMGLSGENSPVATNTLPCYSQCTSSTPYLKDGNRMTVSSSFSQYNQEKNNLSTTFSQPCSQQTSPLSLYQASVSPDLLYPPSNAVYYSQYKTASLPNVPVVVMNKGVNSGFTSNQTGHHNNHNEITEPPRASSSYYQLTTNNNFHQDYSCPPPPPTVTSYNPSLLTPTSTNINENIQAVSSVAPLLNNISRDFSQTSPQKSLKSSREQLADHVRNRLYNRMQANQQRKQQLEQHQQQIQQQILSNPDGLSSSSTGGGALRNQNGLGITMAVSSDCLTSPTTNSFLTPTIQESGSDISSDGHRFRHSRHGRQRSDHPWPYPNVSAFGLQAAASASASALCISSDFSQALYSSIPPPGPSATSATSIILPTGPTVMPISQCTTTTTIPLPPPSSDRRIPLSFTQSVISSYDHNNHHQPVVKQNCLTVSGLDQDPYRRVSSDSAINGRREAPYNQPIDVTNTHLTNHPHPSNISQPLTFHSQNPLYNPGPFSHFQDNVNSCFTKSSGPAMIYNGQNNLNYRNENYRDNNNDDDGDVDCRESSAQMDSSSCIWDFPLLWNSPPLPESLTMDEFSNIPDIVLTTDDQNSSSCRRDSSTMAAEVLSTCIYTGAPMTMTSSSCSAYESLDNNCTTTKKGFIDLNQDDMQLLMDPSYSHYVTDDMTEAQLIREQQVVTENKLTS